MALIFKQEGMKTENVPKLPKRNSSGDDSEIGHSKL